MTLEHIKYGIVAIVSSIFAFLQPIANDLYFMLMLFGFNWLCGVVADQVSSKGWNKKKCMWAFFEAFMFFAFVTFIFATGYFKNNMSGALQCVSFVSYTCLYFYSTNICRNMKLIFPENTTAYKVFSFIYYVLSVEFVKKVPFLQSYLSRNKQ